MYCQHGASTRLSHTWSAYTYGCVAGLQPTGACWGRLGTSASVHTRLGWATSAWRHRLAPAMILGPPSISCCCKRSRGTSCHPIPAAVHPPWHVRFASPITKAEATTSQSQSVVERGRPQTREQRGHQEQASHSRTRKDWSSTRGPKRQGVLPARILWRTSWTLCPPGGRGISST